MGPVKPMSEAQSQTGEAAHKTARRDSRFERCTRLFGSEGMKKLAASRVTVFGLGGVGSYAVEGLARSGIGDLTLVDFDLVCVTNINRQLHALTGTVGQSKAELMGRRVLEINPHIKVRTFAEFYDKNTSDRLLAPCPDVVIDCIDNVTAKMHLLATCAGQGIPVVTSLGSGAKLDPTRVRIVRLTETHTDPLGRALRKNIRRKHKVTDEHLDRVVAVFSDEPVVPPITDHGGVVCGVDCVCPNSGNAHHTCSRRHVIHGTAAFVTAVFGMAAAGAAVHILLGMDPFSRPIACECCGRIVDPLKPREHKSKRIR